MPDIPGMRIPTLAKLLFWPAATFAFVMAVLPQGTVTMEASDKSQHVAAFFTLALLGRLGFPAVNPVAIGLALAGLGGAIEIVQMIPALHRSSEWMDFFADCGAIVAGLGIASIALYGPPATPQAVSPAE